MTSARLSKHNRKLVLVIVLLIVFAAGFLIARTRYKPQIRASFDMVMDRENEISDLKEKIKAYEKQMMMEATKKR